MEAHDIVFVPICLKPAPRWRHPSSRGPFSVRGQGIFASRVV